MLAFSSTFPAWYLRVAIVVGLDNLQNSGQSRGHCGIDKRQQLPERSTDN